MNKNASSRDINRLAIPSIITGLAEPIVTITDTAVVSKINHESMSAVGLSGLFFMVIVWLLSAMKGAIASIIGVHYGKGTQHKTFGLISQALVILIGLGIAISLITASTSTYIFSAIYEAKGEILINCEEYYSIRCIGLPFMLGTYLIFGVFKGFQNTSWAMLVTLIGAGINIILDLILVHGFQNIPAYGISGAAWASVIAQGIMFSASCYLLVTKVKFRFSFNFKIDQDVPGLLLMSFDLLVRTALLNLVFILANRFATKMGKEFIAAHTLASQFWMFAAYFIDGYSNAGIAIASRLKGQQDKTGIYKVTLQLLGKGVIIAALAMLIFLILQPYIGDIFSDDQKVLDSFNSIFLFVLLSQPINAVAFILDGVFIGTGNMKAMRNSMLISSAFGFFLCWFILHPYTAPLVALWSSLTLWVVLRAITLTFPFFRSYFKYRDG